MPRDMAEATLPETNHTPGPWGVERTDTMLWVGPLRHEGGKVAEIVAPIAWGRDYRADYLAKQEANAALIARAPDLLAENERLREALRLVAKAEYNPTQWQAIELKNVARAALKEGASR